MDKKTSPLINKTSPKTKQEYAFTSFIFALEPNQINQ